MRVFTITFMFVFLGIVNPTSMDTLAEIRLTSQHPSSTLLILYQSG
jgi:hypothetical protein